MQERACYDNKGQTRTLTLTVKVWLPNRSGRQLLENLVLWLFLSQPTNKEKIITFNYITYVERGGVNAVPSTA